MAEARAARSGGRRTTIGGWGSVAGRLLLVVLGGYVTTSALVAGAAVCFSLFLHRSEAAVLASMLGFVVYAALLLWGFAERKLIRLAFGLSSLTALGLAALALMPSFGN